MKWPRCPNCGSEKVNVTVQDKTERCNCCGGHKHLHAHGWMAWCYICDLWGDLCETPQEAIDNFKQKEKEEDY